MRLAFIGALLCGALSYAQFETSEVLGTVRDPSGSPVSKAKVTLLNQDTGIQASATTNDAGEYDFVNVKVGRYTLTVEMAGFPSSRHRISGWTSRHGSVWTRSWRSGW